LQDLHVTEWGDGSRVVLVHGSLGFGEETWGGLKPLGDAGFNLVLPDRRGHGQSPPVEGEDYERDAADLVPLLGDGAHLVGHSYGGISALWTAALRPEAVRSLTLIEPSCFGLVPDDPAAAAYMDRFRALWAQTELSDREFIREFMLLMDFPPAEINEELLDEVEPAVPVFRAGRPVWDASVPVAVLNAVMFPTLVISGGHSPAFDAVCDALVEAMGATGLVLAGAGHSVPELADELNPVLADFWHAAEARED